MLVAGLVLLSEGKGVICFGKGGMGTYSAEGRNDC